MTAFADTSFLVSLYVPDAHSPIGTPIMARIKDSVLITPLIEIEVYNAIQLRVFRKTASASGAQTAARAFEQDILDGVLSMQPLSSSLFEQAKRLALKHTATIGTRGFDLIHVASALTLGTSSLLSFDQNQRKLAQTCGLALQPRTLSHLSKTP